MKSQCWQQMIRHLRLPKERSEILEKALKYWQRDAGIAWGALTLIGLILLMGRWTFDDPYITYRYASNLLAGNGLVYNTGQITFSTTVPLYAILLAGLSLLSPNLPALGNTLSALAVVLSAVFLFKWAQRNGEQATGMIAASLLSLSPLLLMTFGAETCVYVMLLLGGFYAYDRSRFGVAAGVLALAAMIRPDGLLAAITLSGYHLLRRRPIAWQPVVIYAALVGGWYGSLWLYFGSPVPVTLLAKQQQGQMAVSTRFGAGLLELIREHGNRPLYWLHGVLALVGLGRVATRARHWVPLLIWTALYLVTYTTLGVSRYFWYYSPLVPAFVVLVAEGAVTLIRWVARVKLSQSLVAGATGLLLITLLAPLLNGVLWISWHPERQLALYREIGEWLAAHTPRQASVGALEIGIIGYYAQRPMIDFAGLIQPDVALQLTPGSTYEESVTWAVQTYQPDYVVLHRGAAYSPIGRDWFQETYRPVRNFTDQGALWMTLYHRREGQ